MYQSCEHDAWEDSVAYALVEAIIAKAEEHIPAADKTPVERYGRPRPAYRTGPLYEAMPWAYHDGDTNELAKATAHYWTVPARIAS